MWHETKALTGSAKLSETCDDYRHDIVHMLRKPFEAIYFCLGFTHKRPIVASVSCRLVFSIRHASP